MVPKLSLGTIKRDLMATFELGMFNAWLLSLPFVIITTIMVGLKKNIVKRMSDMTGYTAREKFITMSASLLPYPFMIATIWVPLITLLPLLCFGLIVYMLGMAGCVSSLRVIIKTPPDEPFMDGPYRFSRNPMYVSATAVFSGICLATANFVLACYLTIAVLLQHFMILAEERICKEKYGGAFEGYLRKVPRYLFMF